MSFMPGEVLRTRMSAFVFLFEATRVKKSWTTGSIHVTSVSFFAAFSCLLAFAGIGLLAFSVETITFPPATIGAGAGAGGAG